MSDEELINLIADVWIANGGDAEGMLWTWRLIYERIKEKE